MKKAALSVIALGMITTQALAASSTYFNLGGGYVVPIRNFNSTSTSNYVNYSPTSSGSGTFNASNVLWKNILDNGGEINVAIGHAISNNVRIEGEFMFQSMSRNISGSYSWNEIIPGSGDTFANQTNVPISNSNASYKVYAFMANFYYDFKNKSKWTPTVGAGIGTAHILCGNTESNDTLNLNDLNTGTTTTVPTLVTSPSLSSTVFAWQVKLGMDYKIDDNFTIQGDYRLFGTTSFKTSGSSIIANPTASNTANTATFTLPPGNVDSLLENVLELNLRYYF